MKDSGKVYFSGMNGIRFLAAFSVILHHAEQTKFWQKIPNLWTNPFIDNIGHKGRILFFVMSGFLITYMFFAELKKNNTIDVRKFHIRRTLRVWPVYLLAVLMCFFILPYFNIITNNYSWRYGSALFNDLLKIDFWEKLFLYAFMLPNVVRFVWDPIAGASQLWSIGVQEQFYLIWPTMSRIFKKYLWQMIVAFILFKVLVEGILVFFYSNWDIVQLPVINHDQLKTLIYFWRIFAVEQLALGALTAYIFIEKKNSILNVLYSRYLTIPVSLLFIYLFFINVDFVFHGLIEGIIGCVLVLNISTNVKFPVKLEHPYLNYLGNISYGIYLYHNFFLFAVISGLVHFGLQDNLVVFNILLYFFTIVLTLGFSALSYKYLEMFFLNIKDKFKVIKSIR